MVDVAHRTAKPIEFVIIVRVCVTSVSYFLLLESHASHHKKKDAAMPTQHPHRAQGLCTSNKVYSALTELKSLEGHRTAKFLSLLAQNLVEKGVLSDHEVVAMLDQVVN